MNNEGLNVCILFFFSENILKLKDPQILLFISHVKTTGQILFLSISMKYCYRNIAMLLTLQCMLGRLRMLSATALAPSSQKSFFVTLVTLNSLNLNLSALKCKGNEDEEDQAEEEQKVV